MLLVDQIPRNAFRGTAEAFAYDQMAARIAQAIYERGLYKSYDRAAWIFLCTPGEHSEDRASHEINLEFIGYAERKWGEGSVSNAKSAVLDHKEVIDRFGRFPHRLNI